ncbi:nuclear pore complex protein NUP1-like isoform X1 [Zingiber officinale]|uniref:Nuclear pore complex protein NUP1-like n=1 Tax=Zingiber officinale TaxID=94328 RepID=A0A8J5IG29_ZINOF|nr:nuclear pore complex protein NUP1-like isoform X1 [Zingiber officinale]KAG6533479.1 hypothetical protein ZIOFF_007351 [Zingiber officinale]
MAEYEGSGGGIGGKIRRRYFRRTTPYDRPATAARPIRELQAAESRNGWLSKLVDPASRAIAWSASILFPSVFQGRLEAPLPATSEAKQGSEKEVLEEYHANLLPARQEQFPSHGKNPFNYLNTGNAQDGTHSSCTDGELDQLLIKKTYTRSEYDRIAQILRLRVTETSKPVENNDMGEVPDKVDNQKQCPISPTVQPTSSYVKNNKAVASAEEAKNTCNLHGNDASQASLLSVSKEEVGSPTKIAKGYMSLRPSELYPTALSMQTQNFMMDRTFPSGPSHAKQSFDKSMALRSLVQHSQPLEFTNSELHGRSTFNKMSHSPYFKPHSVANTEVSNPYEITPQNHTRLKLHGRSAIYKMARSPYLKPHSVANPRKMLKRGSSVLDDGIGPVSPIRRIRHKSNITSPPRSSFSSMRHFPSSSTYVDPSSVPSSQKLLHWSEQKKNDKDPHNVESIMSPIVPIPPQSSEMARKILEQLDKLAPAPKVKSSNLKIGMDESPLMLTHDILSSPALKSMEKIEMTKFVNVQENGSSESPKDGLHQRNPISEKQYMAEETGSAASDPPKFERAVTEVKPSVSATHFTVSDVATIPTTRKPAFQMSVPEDLDELDDESDSIKDSSASANGKSELLPDIQITQIAETRLEASKISSSNGVLVSTSMLDANAMKVPNVSGNGDLNGLDFPVLPLPGSSSMPSTIPTSAMPPFQPTPLKEKASSPILKDGLMVYSAGSPSMTAGSDGPNFLARDHNRKGIFSDFDKVGKTLKGGDIFNALGNAAPSSLSTSPNWSLTTSFGISSTSKLSNDTASLTNEPMKPSIFTSSNSTTPSTSVSLSSTVSTSSVPPLSVFTSMSSSPSPPSALSSDSTSLNGLLKFGVPSQPSGASSLFSISSSQSISFGASAGSSFSSQPVANSSAVSKPLLSTSVDAIQASTSAAPLFGLSSAATKPLGASSGLTFPTFTGSSSNSSSSTTTMSTLNFGSSSGFSLSRSTISSQSAGSSSSLISTAPFGLSSVSPIFTGKSSESGSSSTVVSSSGFSLSSANASSQSSGSSNSLVSTAPFGSSNAAFLPGTTFSINFGASTTSFGSSTQESQSSVSVPTFGSISSSPIAGFSFGSNTQASQSSGSIPTFDSTSSSPVTGFSFGVNTQASQSSVSVSTFNSTSSSPSTGFSFGSTPSGSSPFPFVASSMPAFSFGSTGSTSSLSASPAPSLFGTPNQLVALNSSPGNDQMSVEDSMADDPVQPSASLGTLGQPTNMPSPNFIYGSPAAPGGQQTFQFGSQQNNFAPSPFQPAPNLDFTAGSSFSWGTGGGDKSGRKFVKVRRDKHRRK